MLKFQIWMAHICGGGAVLIEMGKEDQKRVASVMTWMLKCEKILLCDVYSQERQVMPQVIKEPGL